ncbi:MAG: TonB-dependent receptor [Chitinophagales bacterium]|nr:TonB-dependent receptor [Chitinophagales bacterium]
MSCKIYFVLISSIFAALVKAQNAKVIGVVKEENGDPLVSANVIIDAAKGWAAVTDFDGKFEISVPPGSYTVSFKYVGKEEQNIKVTLSPGEVKTLNVTLAEKQQIIDVVVVTGSKYEKKLSEETVSLEVLKSDVINNQNVTSVDNAVQKIPSVTIADGQANIRGGSGWSYGAGSRVAVLYDDLLITTADADDAKWGMIPVENIEQIEVLKGAASSIYGSGALNGVINTRMAYPTEDPFTRLQTYVGFYEGPTRTRSMKWWQGNPQYFAGFNFGDRRKIGQWDIITGTAYNNDRGWLDSSDSQDFRVNAKIRHRFKKVTGLTAGANVLAMWSWGKTFFLWDSVGPKGMRPLPNTITKYDNSRYIVDPFVTCYDSKNNKFTFRYRWLNSSNVNSTGQGSIAHRHIFDVSYQRPFEIKENIKLNFIAGVGGRIDRIAPPKNPNDLTPDSIRQKIIDSLGYYPIPYLYGDKKHRGNNASIYAQVDGKFFDRLNVTLGLRWEYFNVDGRNSLKDLPYPLLRLGINYQAAKATYVRGSFGQGFRYPSIAELFVTTKVGGALEIFPNVNLKPEKGYSAEIGVKQGFKFGKNSRTMGYVDVAGFWNQFDNMMEFIFGQFGKFDFLAGKYGVGFSSQNVGDTRILGVDGALGFQTFAGPVEFNLLGGYTYISTTALNWDKPIIIYNSEGDTIKPSNEGGFAQTSYNNANAPAGLDTNQYITYGMLSSSSKNMLKYRPDHQFKLIFNIIHKRFEVNMDYQFIAYQKNIDYAFVSPFFAGVPVSAVLGIQSFRGLYEYRKELERRNYKGDNILNIALGYKPIDNFKMSFIIKNVLNWEWMPRPGRFEAPRSYTLQVAYYFRTAK